MIMPVRPPAARIERAITSDQMSISALGVSDHDRLAGGAGGGVDADQFFARHREHVEGIIVAQVGLHRERKFGEIGELPEIGGCTPALSNAFL